MFGKTIILKNTFKVLEDVKGMKEVILKSNHLSFFSVGKPLHFRVIRKDKKEFILERNFMKISDILKPLHVTVVSKFIKQQLLE